MKIRLMHLWVLRLAQLSAAGVFLLSITGFLGNLHYLLELTTHFKCQYLAVGLTSLIFFVLQRQRLWFALSLCIVLINLTFVLPWYLPVRETSTQAAGQVADPITNSANRQTALKLLLANVHIANRNYSATLDLIQSIQPDVFVIVETNQAWLNQLTKVESLLPYSIASPNAGGFGIALYSKRALNPISIPVLPASTESKVEDYHIAATLKLDQTLITLIAIHPPPPITSTLAALRNQELENVSNFVQTHPATTIVLGDLNTTMWSAAYQKFQQRTGLKNARQGFGILPTWTTRLPIMLIPIDHGLVSPEFKVLEVKTGSDLGSDHLPLIIDVALQTDRSF